MATISEALALASSALAEGDLDRARVLLERVLQVAPHEARAMAGLAGVARHAGDSAGAVAWLERAAQAEPNTASYRNALAEAYGAAGRDEEAIASSRRALELDPESAVLHVNLGVSLKRAGALEEAEAVFRQAIEREPSNAAWFNLGNALAMMLRLDEAVAAFRRALEIAPGDPETLNNLSNVLRVQGHNHEALECLNAAIPRGGPELAAMHRNRATLRLTIGDYERGWVEHEWRNRVADFQFPTMLLPRWQGEPLDDRHLLIVWEQALGDTIQMIRYPAELKRRYRGVRITLWCPEGWHRLLKTAPGIDALTSTGLEKVGGDDVAVAPPARSEADYYIPTFSLPRLMRTTLETIPREIPYLHAEQQLVALWHDRLASTRALRVGIAWQGNPNFKGDEHRSIPLAHYAPLAELANVQLYSLQKNFGSEQLADFTCRDLVIDLATTLDDGTGAFVETAGVMKNLDLVVTSDTAMAHVAGALGVPVWVALQLSPNWRWMLDRADNPWYPTMRLFRQRTFGDWPQVFADIAAALMELSELRTSSRQG